MSFGKRVVKKSTPKKVNNSKHSRIKQDKIDRDEIVRENLIFDSIKGILECTDAGCCPVEHIKKKMSGVKELEIIIKKCVKKNGFILHRGWLYNTLWTIEDLNEISNDTVIIDDFNDDNPKLDNDLLMKLTALYEKQNEAIKITWFEMLINKGVLHMTEKELYNSFERLMRTGKIYEPTIGMFAPTYDSL